MHKGTAYPGEHEALIDRDTFDNVQAILATNGRTRAARRAKPALLKGLLFAENGHAMTPAFTKRGSRLYRYYVSTDAIRGRANADRVERTGRNSETPTVPLRLPADTVETIVLREVRRLIRAPEVVAQAVAAARQDDPAIEERDIVAAIHRFDEIWSALFPAEQARVVQLLVERVVVMSEGIAVDLRTDGLRSVVREMLLPQEAERVA